MELSVKKVWTVFLSWVAEEMFFNLMGTRELMPEILKAFIPTIGATAATVAVFGMLGLLRDWDTSLASRAISDLESFIESGESYFKGVRTLRPPRTEAMRFTVLAQKYMAWTANKVPDGHSLDDTSLNRAARCAEFFRAYVYFRGRWKIYREMKDRK